MVNKLPSALQRAKAGPPGQSDIHALRIPTLVWVMPAKLIWPLAEPLGVLKLPEITFGERGIKNSICPCGWAKVVTAGELLRLTLLGTVQLPTFVVPPTKVILRVAEPPPTP